MNKMTGGFYRFRSGFRVVTSEPVSYEGQMCVQVAQAYIRFTEPMTVRVNEDGTAYAYPGRAYLPLSLLSHEMELFGPPVDGFRAYQQKLIKVVPKRKRPRRKKKTK